MIFTPYFSGPCFKRSYSLESDFCVLLIRSEQQQLIYQSYQNMIDLTNDKTIFRFIFGQLCINYFMIFWRVSRYVNVQEINYFEVWLDFLIDNKTCLNLIKIYLGKECSSLTKNLLWLSEKVWSKTEITMGISFEREP